MSFGLLTMLMVRMLALRSHGAVRLHGDRAFDRAAQRSAPTAFRSRRLPRANARALAGSRVAALPLRCAHSRGSPRGPRPILSRASDRHSWPAVACAPVQRPAPRRAPAAVLAAAPDRRWSPADPRRRYDPEFA